MMACANARASSISVNSSFSVTVVSNRPWR
jgi:hypothetical protein